MDNLNEIEKEIKAHPLAAVSIAGAVGFVASFWFRRTWFPLITTVISVVDPDLKKVKGALLHLAAKTSETVAAKMRQSKTSP